MPTDAHSLLHSIEELLDRREPFLLPEVLWVGGRALSDDSLVVLYRETETGPILGRMYNVPQFGALFGNELSTQEMAQIIVNDEILEPTGRGIAMCTEWARGLVRPEETVEWVGISAEERP